MSKVQECLKEKANCTYEPLSGLKYRNRKTAVERNIRGRDKIVQWCSFVVEPFGGSKEGEAKKIITQKIERKRERNEKLEKFKISGGLSRRKE